MSGQKFIARNRAPRVQIEYDVEVYGSQKRIQLPFVMGVMADLSGQPLQPLAPLQERQFQEIDVDNFDARMKSVQPRVAFEVDNRLTGEGQLPVELDFQCMEDFNPAAIARQLEPMRKLLEARQQLANLLTYMDGKAGAEALLNRILGDSTLLGQLGQSAAVLAAHESKNEPEGGAANSVGSQEDPAPGGFASTPPDQPTGA